MTQEVNIQVGGNVDGNIVVGDNNFVVNTNHGTIIYKTTAPQVRARQFVPRPPRAPRGFINRTDELAKLERWITANEVVVIHAADGMGKTSLLKQAANGAAAQSMPGGVILLESVDASGQALGPDDIIQRLFDALFESEPPLKVDATSARTYLSNTRPLILLDEVPLSPALQNALPDLFPQGSILFSADLPISDDFPRLAVGPLPRNESISLLAARIGIDADENNHATLDGLCAALGNVSLALVITGNVIRETNTAPETALQTIQQISSSERNPARAALDRAFQFAYAQLSPEEQTLLATAAHTPGISSSPDWLSYALGGQADAFIERLTALGLLYTNSPRLRLPPAFRALAQTHAPVSEADTYTRLDEYLSKKLEANTRNWDFFNDELGNLMGLFNRAIQHKDWASAIRVGRALDPYLTLKGLWDGWGHILTEMLDAARASGDQFAEAWALHQGGTRLAGLGQIDTGIQLLKQALQLREQLGDVRGAAHTHHNLQQLLPPPPPTKPNKSPRRGFKRLLFGGVATLAVIGVLLSPFSPFRPATPTAKPSDTPTRTPTATATIKPTERPSAIPSPVTDTTAPVVDKLWAEPDPSHYGQLAEQCQAQTQVTFSLYATDDSGISAVTLRYRYEADNLTGEWYEETLKPDGFFYSITIDNNFEDRALNTLDNLDGSIVWEVTVSDSAGNHITENGHPVSVKYALCDTSGPQIQRPYASPGTGTYGDIKYCGAGISSYLEFHTYVHDESGIKQVYVEYAYKIKVTGPKHTVLLSPKDSQHYFTGIDLNNDAQAILKGQDGSIVWTVYATDTRGNLSQSKPITTPVNYKFCPPPG